MSAQAQQLEVRFECLGLADLDDVMRIERLSYGHPWSRGAFEDSIAAGYQMQRLLAGNALLGYFVAMKGVDEVHLLNITVAPKHQLQGWGRLMLDALALWSRGQGAQWLWLEVRVSNLHAKALYIRYGFREVGLRKGYYPEGGTSLLGTSAREDAVVMSFRLSGAAP